MNEVPFFVTEFKSRKNPTARAPRYKVSLVREHGSVYATAKPINTGGRAYQVAKELFEEADREAFYVICLDSKLKIIGINLVSLGTLNASLVHPREVFKAAILLNSLSIICAHNHPSGEPEPSRADDELTRRLVVAGMLLGIGVNDHIICGQYTFYSYSAQGRIDEWTHQGSKY